MLDRSDLGRPNHAAVLGELSVAAVWRLKGVSRAFRGWCRSALAAMPRVVAVGGEKEDMEGEDEGDDMAPVTNVSVDLATLAWGGECAVPDLPAPCMGCSLGQLPGGRGAVGGGWRRRLTWRRRLRDACHLRVGAGAHGVDAAATHGHRS
jgi:hypothetical protein